MTGLRPNAELEGLATLLGLGIAVPATGLMIMAGSCLTRALRGHPSAPALSAALGAIETAVGIAFACIVWQTVSPAVESMVTYGAPFRVKRTDVPVLGPALYHLVLGLTSVWFWVRESRRQRLPKSPAAYLTGPGDAS